MAEGDNRSTNLLAAETAGLEEQLQGWGEVILVTDKILRWEKSWFPAAMLSVVSMIFLLVYVALSILVQIKTMVMDYNAFKRISAYRGYQLLQFSPSIFDRLIYYVDPSVLSGVSCFVMLLCLADYLVPALAPRIFGSSKWTTEQQQRFHEICSNLVKTRRKIVGWWKRLFTFKEEKPKMYFTTMVCLLAVIAWIGQQVHNLFLTYLIVCFVLLFPGLNKHGVISKYAGMAKREVNKLLKHKEKKNE